MRQDEAHDVLVSMLCEAGVQLYASRLTAEDPRRAWAVFKAFCAVPVVDLDPERMHERLLVESSLYGQGIGAQYGLTFSRRFLDAGGRGQQVACSFYFEPTPELEELPEDRLSSSGLTRDDFFLLVERLPGFRVPLGRGHAPTDVQVQREHL